MSCSGLLVVAILQLFLILIISTIGSAQFFGTSPENSFILYGAKTLYKKGANVIPNYFGRNVKINKNLLSATCYEDILYMNDIVGINHTSYSPTPEWQKNMIDSNGKLPSGIAEGNIFWLGDFGQCTSVKVWKKTNRALDSSLEPDFKGKYCLPNINHYVEPIASEVVYPIPIVTSIGICVPSSCSPFEVETLVNEMTYPVKIVIEEKNCLTDDPHKIDTYTVYTLVPFAILGILVVTGTIWEVVILMITYKTATTTISKRYGTFKSIILSFSAYTNTKKLLNTSHENPLASINGLRAMSMMMVVAGHGLGVVAAMNSRPNPIHLATYMRKLWLQPIINGVYTVDTFFCLTGFLVAYIVMDTSIKMGRFNVLVFYAHRLWRITPTYLLLTAFAAGPFHLTYTGPLWIASPFFNQTTCRANLWKTPLYIEIYYDMAKPLMCMPHTWYLNAEMALYIVAGIILFPIAKKHWSGPYVLSGALALAFAIIGTLAYRHNLQSIVSPFLNMFRFKDFFEEIYVKPWGRSQPFLIGMCFGYVYYYYGKTLKFGKLVLTGLWTLCAIGMLSCIFINYRYIVEGREEGPSQTYYNTYITFNTAVWGTGIGWIILACATGHGGVINSILSWKYFAPIGRLSFCSYIVHINVLAHFGSSRKEALYTDFKLMVFCVFALNAVCVCVAWILCIMIESPTLQLEAILLQKAKNKYKELETLNKDKSSKYERLPIKENSSYSSNDKIINDQ